MKALRKHICIRCHNEIYEDDWNQPGSMTEPLWAQGRILCPKFDFWDHPGWSQRANSEPDGSDDETMSIYDGPPLRCPYILEQII